MTPRRDAQFNAWIDEQISQLGSGPMDGGAQVNGAAPTEPGTSPSGYPGVKTGSGKTGRFATSRRPTSLNGRDGPARNTGAVISPRHGCATAPVSIDLAIELALEDGNG